MTNIKRVENVLRYLAAGQCREVVICAGARNAPLVVALNAQTKMKLWSLFEERGAGFFALGRIKSLGAPVAVVTTSGTAAAELLPAAIEGHYTGLPLLLVTADRPPGYRGTGAPQAIEQKGIFGPYVEESLDLWNEPAVHAWSGTRPLHVNVCLDEPSRAEMQEIENLFAKWDGLSGPTDSRMVHMPSQSEYETVRQAKVDFVSRSSAPAVVIGGLSKRERPLVKRWLNQVRLPVYLEAPSNLTGETEIQADVIKGGDKALDLALSRDWVDGIIRIGGVPTLRAWRDLETKYQSLPVISFSARAFSGLCRRDANCLRIDELEHFQPAAAKGNPVWEEARAFAASRLVELLRAYPNSEQGMLYALAAKVGPGANLYLGNSLPIREWDLVAGGISNSWSVEANRGANGIDGQLSTFFGFAEPERENWAVIGDLTAMYDLTAPYVLRQRPLPNCNIVIINNRGGQIFSRMYSRIELENRHDVEFSRWAAMWGMNYEHWKSVPPVLSRGTGPRVIEMFPNEEATALFLKEWEAVWADLSKR
jgi:2-succinyl-5-enolpyruvyl-6-hydroxy-3-cyclohexene-1-carboxylate synthase